MQIYGITNLNGANNNTSFGAKIKMNKAVKELIEYTIEGVDEGTVYEKNVVELRNALERLSKVGGNTILECGTARPLSLTSNNNSIWLKNTFNNQIITTEENDSYIDRGSFIRIINKAIDTIESKKFWKSRSKFAQETDNIIHTFFA